MRLPSSTEINNLKATQEDAMADVCNIYHITLSSGTYSTQGTETRSMVSGVACGFVFTGGSTVERGQVLLIDYDVLLRIPANITVRLADEIELVEKGVTMASGTFKVTDNPTVNSTVQHVRLKRQVL